VNSVSEEKRRIMSARPNYAGPRRSHTTEKFKDHEFLLEKLAYQKAKIEKLSVKLTKLKKKVIQQNLHRIQLEKEIKKLTGNSVLIRNCLLCDKTWKASGQHRVAVLKCGHTFGNNCIKKFVAVYQMCPGCEKPAKTEDVHFINGL